MKKSIILSLLAIIALLPAAAQTRNGYEPSEENIAARKEFAEKGFGIFIHWGIYSMFGQGEWYLNGGLNAKEYAKAARGFYPAQFDAAKWVAAFKNAGAKYITITTRHHDGFSMFKSEVSPYNIVDATPFKRDILAELAAECKKQGLGLNLYYSHVDWTRDDYPMGKSGTETGKDPSKADYNAYFDFMNRQLTELLTNYGGGTVVIPAGGVFMSGPIELKSYVDLHLEPNATLLANPDESRHLRVLHRPGI